MPKKSFSCDNCGPLEYALLDGYPVGDRLLEGVMFQVRLAESGVQVEVDPSGAKYFQNLNKKKWLTAVREYAAEADILTCPKCQEDIDGPETLSQA